MKKTLSVILAIVVAFTMTVSFSACSKKSETDTTDSSVSNTINDTTSKEKEDKEVTDKTTKADKNKTTKADGKNKTTVAPTKKNTTKKKTTEKKTTEKKTTTQAPKKRAVSITVQLPNYNNEEHEIVVSYKVKGADNKWDKEWTKLEPQKFIFDGSDTIIKLGKLKGDVSIVLNVPGMNDKLQEGCNKAIIKSNENTYHFALVTGIEMMEDWD